MDTSDRKVMEALGYSISDTTGQPPQEMTEKAKQHKQLRWKHGTGNYTITDLADWLTISPTIVYR